MPINSVRWKRYVGGHVNGVDIKLIRSPSVDGTKEGEGVCSVLAQILSIDTCSNTSTYILYICRCIQQNVLKEFQNEALNEEASEYGFILEGIIRDEDMHPSL